MALGTASNSLDKNFWKEISSNLSSAVKVVHEKLHLCIPPYYLNDLGKSVASVIDCRLIRYEPDLGGILAGYGNLAIRESKAQTLFNLSDIHVDVVGNFYIFNPEVNQELVGIVNRISVDHIGCLVHGLFNISLPKPFNIASESWLGKPAKLLDKVKFSITKVDLYSIVPYIEGKIVELIPQAELSSESRQRTNSDSGVEFASEESTNIALSPEESMEQKRSKLSLSHRKNEAKLSLTSNLNSVPTQNETCEITDQFSEQDKKRKRKISEGSVMKETPKNKKAKLFGGGFTETKNEDTAPVESLTTNLFKKFSKKLEQSSTPSRTPKKAQEISILNETSTDAELVESDEVLDSVESGDPVAKELQVTKSSPKKKTGKNILEGIEEQAKSPKKNKLQQNSEAEFEMTIDSEEERKISFRTPTSTKKSKSRLEKKKEGGSKLSDIETPGKPLKQPSSLKKSKEVKKVNGTATPSKSSKKKSIALEQEGEEEDNESIIQELLGLSLPIASPQSTPVSKKKQTPSAKSAKLAESAKKLKALEKKLDSTPKSVQAQGPETASPMKNLKESSLSKKMLKTPASEAKQTPSVEKTKSVPSPRTPKANGSSKNLVKTASPEKILVAWLPEKEVKAEQTKKRAKLRPNKEKSLKSDASSGDEFDQEQAILKILQLVQPEEKPDKTKTKRKSVNS
ncbi:neurofilament heavy polypeptide-like [Daphnia carinata]|uniref:neurofilament heavy polypeptide-like n=1 Tax=Daphnia carinata TaxID=120202 RepID=UPI002580EBCC|nr:neurofilament heavy polypeptide-like [Daphnia carinata]